MDRFYRKAYMNKSKIRKIIVFTLIAIAIVISAFVFIPQLAAPNEAKIDML